MGAGAAARLHRDARVALLHAKRRVLLHEPAVPAGLRRGPELQRGHAARRVRRVDRRRDGRQAFGDGWSVLFRGELLSAATRAGGWWQRQPGHRVVLGALAGSRAWARRSDSGEPVRALRAHPLLRTTFRAMAAENEMQLWSPDVARAQRAAERPSPTCAGSRRSTRATFADSVTTPHQRGGRRRPRSPSMPRPRRCCAMPTTASR